MEKKASSEDKVKAIVDKLTEGTAAVFSSDKYKQYLSAMSQFHGYSYNNILLILWQNPDASYVAGYKTWETLERYVKKGEKGITILAPCPKKYMKQVQILDSKTGQPLIDNDGRPVTEEKEFTYTKFRPTTVFDISQTEGKELPTLAEELSGQVQDYQILMDSIREVAPAPIRFDMWYESKKGYYSLAEKEIVIKFGMSEMQTIKTAVHETVHSLLHKDTDDLKDSATMEVEAESIAYVVCQSLGLDTSDYSFGYLAGWSANKELPELQSSLATIQKTAHMLIGQMEAQIHKRMHQREMQIDNPEQQIEMHRHRR